MRIALEPDSGSIDLLPGKRALNAPLGLANHYHAHGYYVIAGGGYASLCPERYEALADTVLAAEAEIFPQFCRDFEDGARKRCTARSERWR